MCPSRVPVSEQRKRMVDGAAVHGCPRVLGTGGGAGFATTVLKGCSKGRKADMVHNVTLFTGLNLILTGKYRYLHIT